MESARKTCYSCGRQHDAAPGATTCPYCGNSLLAPSRIDQPTIVEATSGGGLTPSGRISITIPKSINEFEIISVLGRGGMGTVYLAYEPLLDRDVALKVLTPYGSDEDALAQSAARFLSEAVLSGKLTHAGIVPIYSVGHDVTHGYYYTMRYIKGRTLADILHQLEQGDSHNSEYTLNRLLTIFLRVCEAMAFAHKNGVIHRDLKPANIMVAEFGEVLLMDWGLAKSFRNDSAVPDADQLRRQECRRRKISTTQLFLGRSSQKQPGTSLLKKLQSARESTIDRHQTRADQIVGTPGYLSPEQGTASSNLTPASDVYSLGVVLYQILTGKLPIEAVSTQDMIAKTALGELIPLSKRAEASRLPKVLCDIATRALALNPADRYCDAGEMASELALYLEGRAPWKVLVHDRFSGDKLSSHWKVTSPGVEASAGLMSIAAGGSVQNAIPSPGDFRGMFTFWTETREGAWLFSIKILETASDGSAAVRYELRIGLQERSFVELLRFEKRVIRRLDLRLQASQKYKLEVELDHSVLRVYIGGQQAIEYQESFPQIGGKLELSSQTGDFRIEEFVFESRGAPLNLSFMTLPDQLYRSRRFKEAREFYRQLALSHPDREEGLVGRYKAGLCCAELGEMQDAFEEFTRLEGTMLNHYCALGFAHVGMIEGSLDWAWEALKNAFRASSKTIQHEIWFALLALVESLGKNKTDEKMERYRELLNEPHPEPRELGRVACDLLELAFEKNGFPGLRKEAVNLLKSYPNQNYIRQESLLGVSRAGLDKDTLTAASEVVELPAKYNDDSIQARIHLLKAEVCMANGQWDKALVSLRDALAWAGLGSSQSFWIRGWNILNVYLLGLHQQALTEAREIIVRYRKPQATALDYFRLLECLCCLAKGKSLDADTALEKSTGTGIWGITAHHITEIGMPESLRHGLRDFATNQHAEALCLAGEAFRLKGNISLAAEHFKHCLDVKIERAMITRIALDRLREQGMPKENSCVS